MHKSFALTPGEITKLQTVRALALKISPTTLWWPVSLRRHYPTPSHFAEVKPRLFTQSAIVAGNRANRPH